MAVPVADLTVGPMDEQLGPLVLRYPSGSINRLLLSRKCSAYALSTATANSPSIVMGYNVVRRFLIAHFQILSEVVLTRPSPRQSKRGIVIECAFYQAC
jgi:hypothetical protein